VHSRFNTRSGIDVGSGDDPIWRNEHVAVEEVLVRRVAAHVRFPSRRPRRSVEATEEPIARADEHGVTRDRRCVRESPSGCKLPEDASRRFVSGLLASNGRRADQRTEYDHRDECSTCRHFHSSPLAAAQLAQLRMLRPIISYENHTPQR
jgi:hypothetical protein